DRGRQLPPAAQLAARRPLPAGLGQPVDAGRGLGLRRLPRQLRPGLRPGQQRARRHVRPARPPGRQALDLPDLDARCLPRHPERPRSDQPVRGVVQLRLLRIRAPDVGADRDDPRPEGGVLAMASIRTRRDLSVLVVLATLGLAATAGRADDALLVKPRPRQGYYLALGEHFTLANVREEGDSLGALVGASTSLRLGQLLTPRLGLGLAIDFGGVKDHPDQASLFALGLAGQ